MAPNKKGKQENKLQGRKLKKAARRTFAGLFMASAIMVAAIPPRDTTAKITEAETSYTVSKLQQKLDNDGTSFGYLAGISDLEAQVIDEVSYDDSLVCSSNKLGDGKSGTVYTVSQSSNEAKELIWQYKYFITTFNGIQGAVIYQYNAFRGREETLIVPDELVTEYRSFDSSTVDEYYNNLSSSETSLSVVYNAPYSETMPEDYTKYLSGYSFTYNGETKSANVAKGIFENYPDAQDKCREWVASLYENPSDPVYDSKTWTDLGTEMITERSEQNILFCDLAAQGVFNGASFLNGWRQATLDLVRKGDSGDYSYLVRYLDDTKYGKFENGIGVDEQGYVYDDYIPLYGIGAYYATNNQSMDVGSASDHIIRGAFQGVDNVENIVIGQSEIKDQKPQQIGPYAFNGCSSLETIELTNSSSIGARSFKNCKNLVSVQLNENIASIGTEAFYGCSSLDSCKAEGVDGWDIVIPQQVSSIGVGAFAYCETVESVSFENLNTDCDILDYAFYNDLNLNSPDMNTTHINSLGNGVFALDDKNGLPWTSVDLPVVKNGPSGDESSGSYGDYMFYNRDHIDQVNIPGNYGGSKKAYLYDNFLRNCSYLKQLHFDDTNGGKCSYVMFNGDELFSSIIGDSDADADVFFVYGPKTAIQGGTSMPEPRRSTLGSLWGGSTAEHQYVPYRYVENGKTYTETQSGNFYLTIDEDGVLVSCTYADSSTADPVLTIPAKIGDQKVTALGPDCFDDTVRGLVEELVIADDSISTIADEVFKGFSLLEKVTIGNSVTSIGSNVFQDCPRLEDITFNHENDNLTVGDGTFATGSAKLTIHGRISEGFAPYTYAMDPENYANKNTGVRIRYISSFPSYLTVMYDDNTEKITLLDYPKYDTLDEQFTDYRQEQMTKYYNQYKGEKEGRSLRYDYACAIIDYLSESIKGNEVSWDTVDAANGPWVNADWLGASDSYEYQLCNNNKHDLIDPDYLVYFYENHYQDLAARGYFSKAEDWNILSPFKPIKAYAATSSADLAEILGIDEAEAVNVRTGYTQIFDNHILNNVSDQAISSTEGVAIPYFNAQTVGGTEYDHCYSITGNAENPHGNVGLNEDERALINACEEIEVPAGVDSIDAYAYYSNTANGANISAYFKAGTDLSLEVAKMYMGSLVNGYGSTTDEHPGLFSGYYVEEDSGEVKAIGNDRIKKIILNTVDTLPDYCFESCENLETAKLGNLQDIGKVPFKGCTSMKTVETTNNKYFSDNQIVYEDLGANKFRIIEGLASRGKDGYGSAVISSAEDEKLLSTVDIADNAFQECEGITRAVLTDMEMVDTIPVDCFKDCTLLNSVELPENVTTIRDGAFEGDGVVVSIPAKEVQIDDDAFDHDWGSTIRTRSDSAAARYAEPHKVNLDVDNNYKVTFIDYDGSMWDEQTVAEYGAAVLPANPTRDGYTFIGWRVIGDEGDYKYVTCDMTLMAQYEKNPEEQKKGTVTGNSKKKEEGGGGGGSSSKTTKYRVIVEYGSGDGDYEKDSTVSIYANDPPSGNVFDRWVVISGLSSLNDAGNRFTTFKMPTNEVRVQATYKKDTGTSGNTSSRTSSLGSYASDDGTSKRASTTSKTSTGNTGRTSVIVNSSGITNQDLANAVVHGSTDNFVVRITQDDSTTGQVEEALRATYGTLDNLLYYPMNIQLFNADGTMQISDTSGLTVDITVPLPDALRTYGGNNKVAAIRAGSLETLAPRFTSISGVPCITFTASHFSPYVIWTDTAHLADGLMDANPKTGDVEPKWFLSGGLAAISLLLFFKKDKKIRKTAG